MHANKDRILQVQSALSIYQELITKHNINREFSIEIKALGSWSTSSGCVCLYADLSKESALKVKLLAKEVRDFIKAFIVDNIILEINLPQIQSGQNERHRDDINSSDDDFDIPVNNNRSIDPNVHNYDEESEDDENTEEKASNFIYSEESSSSGEEKEDENKEDKDEDNEDDDSEDSDKKIRGFWIDDPKPSIYIPHLTLLKTDPKWDKKLRTTLNDGKGKSTKREKAGKHGAIKPKREEAKTREPFGWSFSLYREIRNEYSKIIFGVQLVENLEMQSGWQCLTSLVLPK